MEIVIRADDDPDDITQPRGKQDWLAEPHGVWYPCTTGLWQPVWLEVLPSRYIAAVTWRPDQESGLIDCEVTLAGKSRTTEKIAVRLTLGDEVLAEQEVDVRSDRVRFAVHIDELANGVDRHRLFWSPETPNLVIAGLKILGAGDVIDQVGSYFGIRTVATKDGHFLLNGRPYFLRLVLEQGLWPESHLAAPSEAALRDEVELVKRLGFNGARLHQKIEDPRFLAWCDRLGLLVWEEMPSCYGFNTTSIVRLSREWADVIIRDRSHPSVVAWVPLNESWGVPDVGRCADQQSLALALVNLARALDGSRPVVSNDGWEHVDSDIWTVHDYAPDAGTLWRATVRATPSTRPCPAVGQGDILSWCPTSPERASRSCSPSSAGSESHRMRTTHGMPIRSCRPRTCTPTASPSWSRPSWPRPTCPGFATRS